MLRQNTPTSLSPPGRHSSPSRDIRTRSSPGRQVSSYSTYGSGIGTSGMVSPGRPADVACRWTRTTSRTVVADRFAWSPQTTRIASYALPVPGGSEDGVAHAPRLVLDAHRDVAAADLVGREVAERGLARGGHDHVDMLDPRRKPAVQQVPHGDAVGELEHDLRDAEAEPGATPGRRDHRADPPVTHGCSRPGSRRETISSRCRTGERPGSGLGRVDLERHQPGADGGRHPVGRVLHGDGVVGVDGPATAGFAVEHRVWLARPGRRRR